MYEFMDMLMQELAIAIDGRRDGRSAHEMHTEEIEGTANEEERGELRWLASRR